MTLAVEKELEWADVYGRARVAAPEAFHDDRLLNFWGGRWRCDGTPVPAVSPLDGTEITGPSMLDAAAAAKAVRASLNEHRTWAFASSAERADRVLAALTDLAREHDLLALLQAWERGTAWSPAAADVDRCLDGVREHLAESRRKQETLRGPVSNVGGEGGPLGVLLRAMLTQALDGVAALAKAPASGGVACLTLAVALAARHGLPLTLVSGVDPGVTAALTRPDVVGRVADWSG